MLFDFLFKNRSGDTSINERIDNQEFTDSEIEKLVKDELKVLTLGELVDYYFETRCRELDKIKPKTRKRKVAK